MSDPVHNPAHYTVYPVQPIEISRHLGFCLGNVVKYVLRAPYKGGIEDLNKALKYLEWEAETPGRDVAHWRALQLGVLLEELRGHLRGAEGDTPWDVDITDIQADFLIALEDYIADPDMGVAAMLKHVRELVQAIAGKARETGACAEAYGWNEQPDDDQENGNREAAA